jgi:hypothetical protein
MFSGLVVGACDERPPGDRKAALEIVARAIRAAGGEGTLARYGARTWKERAIFHGATGDEQYEASYSAEWPDKLRVEIGDFTMVVNGDSGWVRTEGKTREMTRVELEEHKEGIFSTWVQSLVPLRNEEFTLSVVGDAQVSGRPTDGVTASRQGHFDVNMYFDRETGLLAMTQTRFIEATSGKEVSQETILGSYKDVSGIRSPTKVSIKRDGKVVVDASIELSYVERLDGRLFAKP